MRFQTLHDLHARVRNNSMTTEQLGSQSVEMVCHAIDLAVAFYPKPVLCLQRSAAATLILRRFGWNAQLVIGAQVMPFKSHAWTEVNGQVVNDKPYVVDIYTVLERC
jgi:hypothetical protein